MEASTIAVAVRPAFRRFCPQDQRKPGAYTTRANYLSTYYELNKDMLKQKDAIPPKPENLPPRVQIGDDCVIG